MFKIYELWTVILWYELNPRVRCAFGNVFYVSNTMVSIVQLSWPCQNKYAGVKRKNKAERNPSQSIVVIIYWIYNIQPNKKRGENSQKEKGWVHRNWQPNFLSPLSQSRLPSTQSFSAKTHFRPAGHIHFFLIFLKTPKNIVPGWRCKEFRL